MKITTSWNPTCLLWLHLHLDLGHFLDVREQLVLLLGASTIHVTMVPSSLVEPKSLHLSIYCILVNYSLFIYVASITSIDIAHSLSQPQLLLSNHWFIITIG